VEDLVSVLHNYLASSGDEKAKRGIGLTPRELDIVGAIVSGFTNREIAVRLSIREQTVKHHLRNIFDKAGVSNRLELALFAIHHALVQKN
jgi:DNA-binding NarL/FixJ family response regulator